MVTKTYLVSFHVNRKIVHVKAGEQLLRNSLSAFGLEGGDEYSYFMQVWNEEWKEYVDVEDKSEVAGRAKLKLIR